MQRVDVTVLPAEAAEFEADTRVVVDVLRATTTIATLFGCGLKSLTVTDDLDRARSLASGKKGTLLIGEVHGLAPEGFDLGNSPVEAAAASVKGRDAVMFTTNGTRALCEEGGRGAVYAGAIVNAGAIAAALAGAESVLLVCAGNGRGTVFALEDFMASGMIVRRLLETGGRWEMGDAARAALSLAGHWGPAGIRGSRHAAGLAELGLAADIEYALTPDTSDAAPKVISCSDGYAKLTA